MLITEIRTHLSETFDIVYHEFDALCRGNLPASRLLAYLFGLTEVLENNPKYAVREGWIYKSGRNLWEDLGLTRRGYERRGIIWWTWAWWPTSARACTGL